MRIGLMSRFRFYSVDVKAHMDAQNDKAFQAEHGELIEQHASTIKRISNEIVCRCSRNGDAHTTTLSILTMVSEYTWEAKVALTLTAFSAYYGDFWLIAQLYAADSSAKPVAILNQLPESMEHQLSYKPKFEAIDSLLRAIVNVSKLVAEFKEILRGLYSTKDTPAYKSTNAVIQRAAYWIIRSMVACASQIAGLISISNEYIPSTTEAWELDNLHMHLYKLIVHHTLDTPQVDNMKILQLLIYSKEDQLFLWDCYAKQRVNIDVLRKRHVLLLISDLNLSLEELSILGHTYSTRIRGQYEILWLPVIDSSAPWNDEKTRQFEALQSMMPWYTVHPHSQIGPVVLDYIEKVWHFTKKPTLVVLDPQGKITNPNALHMMWIWRSSLAFPFSRAREETLWSEEELSLEFLVDPINPFILEWIREEKVICLYGGEDLEWIQKFTAKLKDIALAAKVALEMLYVGRSNPNKKIRRNVVIATRRLGHVIPDLTLVNFWKRLKSMRDSIIQLGETVKYEPILEEVKTMMSFDGCRPGWALISKGSSNMVKANGDTFVMCLDDFDQWKEDARVKGFVQAINDYLLNKGLVVRPLWAVWRDARSKSKYNTTRKQLIYEGQTPSENIKNPSENAVSDGFPSEPAVGDPFVGYLGYTEGFSVGNHLTKGIPDEFQFPETFVSPELYVRRKVPTELYPSEFPHFRRNYPSEGPTFPRDKSVGNRDSYEGLLSFIRSPFPRE